MNQLHQDKQTNSTPSPPAPASRVVRRFSFWRMLASLGPLLALLLVTAIFTLINGTGFISVANMQTIFSDAVIVTLAAIGMTMVIIGGGIDLSTGSVVALASVLCAHAMAAAGGGAGGTLTPTAWAAGFAAGIGAGMACGLVNGLAVTGLRVVPFIATLGMLSVARGGAKWLSHNVPVDINYAFGNWVLPFVDPPWLVLAPSVWITLALVVIFVLVLRRTVFGRHVVALGSSELTARLCGLKINRLKISLYLIAGACAGLAGVVQTARLTRGDPSVAVGLELNVIAAVVIGGGSLMGGEGSMLGTLVGSLIMSVLAAGATQAGWENYVQEILVGLIIVLAVALDQLRARRLMNE